MLVKRYGLSTLPFVFGCRCGLQRQSTMNLDLRSCTESASNFSRIRSSREEITVLFRKKRNSLLFLILLLYPLLIRSWEGNTWLPKSFPFHHSVDLKSRILVVHLSYKSQAFSIVLYNSHSIASFASSLFWIVLFTHFTAPFLICWTRSKI